MLAKVLAPKLKAAGVRSYRKMADQFAEHILKNGESPFNFGAGEEARKISISFDEADTLELEKIQRRFIDNLPDLVERISTVTAATVVQSSVRHWKESRYIEIRELEGFRLRLEERWGVGLDSLRVLWALCSEIGQGFHEQLQKSRARKNRSLRVALSRLHIRACQVAHEILILLENGLADGALARWRTLHEISTVSLVIEDGGDDLARRYLAYDVVERKKALDQFRQDYRALGYAEPSRRQIERTTTAYEAAVEKFGPAFSQSYGWAANYLKLKAPRFVDIQKAAGRAMMQSHYKMASYNVHATPRALSFRIGSLNQPDLLTSGSTNAGLDEAGQNMAYSLVLITSRLLRGRTLDDVVSVKTLERLRDSAVESLIRTGKELASEDREIRRVLRKEGMDVEIVW
jgi:hypothetical protein